jgi:4-amino-4-deoxy-L-arabinose transferase-like glycosyltransferase
MRTPHADDPTLRWAKWGLAGLFLAWALIPPLTMPSLTLDAAEGFAWGHGWQLGYAKHPPLQAWLLESTRILFGASSFSHVWLSAACLVLCHFAVWRAARHVVEPVTAFWASAALQTIYFVNYTTPEFNPNVVQLAVFALAGLFALRALETGRPADWLALGATLGIGMYAKYSVALSAVTIALFFIADREARAKLRTPWPYLAAALAVALFIPHVIWMLGAGKPTIAYVMERSTPAHGLPGRISHVIEYLGGLIGTAAPLALLVWFGGGRTLKADWNADVRHRLVYGLAFGPAVLTVLLAIVAGLRIKGAWMAPFFDYVPLALILLSGLDARGARWRMGGPIVGGFAAVALIAYCAANLLHPWVAHKPMRVHFPGQALAAKVEAEWAAREPGHPLKVIIGPTYIASPAAYFAKAHPFARIDDIEAINPWAPESLVEHEGAVLLWNAEQRGDAIPPEFAATRPTLINLGLAVLAYQTGAPLKPARIGMALLPPATP